MGNRRHLHIPRRLDSSYNIAVPAPRSFSRIRPARRTRHGKAPWAAIIFLSLFGIGLALLARYYLLGALEAYNAAAKNADAAGQHAITATSTLLLAIILVVLISGLFMTFRIGRFFFPRKTAPRTKTKYVDAWSESAKRMPTPPPDEP